MFKNRLLECILQLRSKNEKKLYLISYHEGDVFRLYKLDDDLQVIDPPEDLLKNDITSILLVPDLVNLLSIIINEVANLNSETAQEIMLNVNLAINARLLNIYLKTLDELFQIAGTSLDEELKNNGSSEISNFIDYVSKIGDTDRLYDDLLDLLNGYDTKNPADEVLLNTLKLRTQLNTPLREDVKKLIEQLLTDILKTVPEFLTLISNYINLLIKAFQMPDILGKHPIFSGDSPLNGLDYLKYIDLFHKLLDNISSLKGGNPIKYVTEYNSKLKELLDKIKEFTKKIEEFFNKIFNHTKDVKEQDKTTRKIMECMKVKNNEINLKLMNIIMKKLKEFIEEQMQKLVTDEQPLGGLNNFLNSLKALSAMLLDFFNVSMPLDENSIDKMLESAALMVELLMSYSGNEDYPLPNNEYILSKYKEYLNGKLLCGYKPTYEKDDGKIKRINVLVAVVNFIDEAVQQTKNIIKMNGSILQQLFDKLLSAVKSGSYKDILAYLRTILLSNITDAVNLFNTDKVDTIIDYIAGGLLLIYNNGNENFDKKSENISYNDIRKYVQQSRLLDLLEGELIDVVLNGTYEILQLLKGPIVVFTNLEGLEKLTVNATADLFKNGLMVPSEIQKFINQLVVDMMLNLFKQMSDSLHLAKKEYDCIKPLQLKIAKDVSDSILDVFSNTDKLIKQVLNEGLQEQELQKLDPKALKYAMNLIVEAFGLLLKTFKDNSLRIDIGDKI